jgi:predicted transcriptional regulator with HTH domain
VSAVGCFFYYQYTFTHLDFIAREGRSDPSAIAALRVKLMALYVGFFALAEAAFVLMATKEYLQDVLGLSDLEIIAGGTAAPSPPALG